MPKSEAMTRALHGLASLTAAGLLLCSWPLPGWSATPASFVVKQDSIDLFQGPGTGYNIVGSAAAGDTVEVIGQTGAWDEVRTAGGTTGWIAAALVNLDRQASAAAPAAALPAAVTPTTTGVNVRSGPDTGHPVISSASAGDILVVEGQSGQWYKVRTPDGILGWIAGWYTRPVTAPVPTEPSAPAGDGSSSPSSDPGTVTVSQPSVTLFGGPGTGSGIAGQVSRGTVLVVLRTLGSWAEVQLPSGATGWIPAALVGGAGRASEPSRGQTPPPAGNAPYAGKGAWDDIYGKIPQAGDLAGFAAAGITHFYVEVATTQSGFTTQWQGWLNTILPAAHRAGIKVIAWVYVQLANPLADAQLTSQVANYVTPTGDRPDAVAADIESLPQNNTVAAGQLVASYAALTRPKLPAGMPFIAITFPPQYRRTYPFAAMGADFDAVALMDYWHITGNSYSYDDAKSFVANSLTMTANLTGAKTPLEVILQGFDNGTGMPSAREMSGALAGTAGARGYSIYTWDSVLGTPAGDVFDNYR